MTPLRFRQIHLDFHTSPAIPGIGEAFDKQAWQNTLKTGHVNSVTTFATCHHGWSYYETKVGRMHPHLGFDLLQAQFEAAKEMDVNVPIYLTAGVNNWAAYEHPEWREVGHDGRYTGWAQNVIDPGFHKMCFNSPYLALLCEQIREVVRRFPKCDGIFLDIISQNACCCKWCLESMAQLGLDAANEDDRRVNAGQVLEKYYQAATAAAKVDDPDMPVFHNSGHITKGDTDILKYFSHLELESLPTGGWGYDHFPLSAKYCTQLDKDFLGMTGKFHTTWGEFGGFKHPNALRYECAAMIAMGAKCSVGDQLHPCGKLDESTYALIGEAYAEVEAKEAWCDHVRPVADIGLLSSTAVNGSSQRESAAETGAGRVLLESHMLFNILDAEMDFSPYKALLLPDDIRVQAGLKAKIDAYLAQGGKLILSGDSGLNEAGTDFLWGLGADFTGKSAFCPDYVLPAEGLRPSFCNSPLVMYQPSNRIKVTTGKSLGQTFDPYFNRTFRHFCSHQHTPNQLEASGYDGGVISGNILYLAHPVFTIYAAYGAVAYKEYTSNAIKSFLGDGLSVSTNLPSTARLTLMDQPQENRYVLHLLYANTIARGGAMQLSGGNISATKSIEVIEELMPLHQVEVALRPPAPVRKVTLEPEGIEMPFAVREGQLHLTIDQFTCHQMVVLSR